MSNEWLNMYTMEEFLSANIRFLKGEIDYSPFYGPYDDAVKNLTFLGYIDIIPMDGQDSEGSPLIEKRSFLNGMILWQGGDTLSALYHFLRFHRDKFYCFITNDTLNTFPGFPFPQTRYRPNGMESDWVETEFIDKPSDFITKSTLKGYPKRIINMVFSEFLYFHLSARDYNDGSVLELLYKFRNYYWFDSKEVNNNNKSITTLIEQYEYVPPEEIWGAIRTYQDLIEVNTAFIEGKLFKSPYHFGPITSDWSDTGDSSLAQLNRLGFVTVDGQPYLHEISSFLDEKKNEKFSETIQTPYLDGFLLLEHYDAFVEFMKTQPYFYYKAEAHGKKLHNTFPNTRYVVTRERSSRNRSDLDKVEWRTHSATNRSDPDLNDSDIDRDAVPTYGYEYFSIADIFHRYESTLRLLKDNTVEIEIASDYDHHLSIVDMMISFCKTL